MDEHTLGWADFRGNRQYVSTGNLVDDDRCSMIVMDYPDQQRLKIFGRARLVAAQDAPDLVRSLANPGLTRRWGTRRPGHGGGLRLELRAHITPRFTLPELDALVAPLRHSLDALRAENAELRRLLDDAVDARPAQPAGPAQPTSCTGSRTWNVVRPGLDRNRRSPWWRVVTMRQAVSRPSPGP